MASISRNRNSRTDPLLTLSAAGIAVGVAIGIGLFQPQQYKDKDNEINRLKADGFSVIQRTDLCAERKDGKVLRIEIVNTKTADVILGKCITPEVEKK